jgi:septum formation protein
MLITLPYKLILASKSPRRVEMLSALFGSIDCLSPTFEEKVMPHETGTEYVKRNAYGKALSVVPKIQGMNWVVLGADTIVELDGQILEKPSNSAHAVQMLNELSGRSHNVITGFHLIFSTGEEVKEVVTTKVSFRKLYAEEINQYVLTGEPSDKAGSYGIQGLASSFVEVIDGSYTNVVGLPLSQIVQALRTASKL